MADDDHLPEGRTAHECFELARIALDQAEQVLNRATSTLECEKAATSAAIARGWSALGDALAHEPVQLTHQTWVADSFKVADYLGKPIRLEHLAAPVPPDVPEVQPLRHKYPPVITPDNGRCLVCGNDYYTDSAGPLTSVCPGESTSDVPDHVHGHYCNHAWIMPTEPCAKCSQHPQRYQDRCPTNCPEPGEFWVHHRKGDRHT